LTRFRHLGGSKKHTHAWIESPSRTIRNIQQKRSNTKLIQATKQWKGSALVNSSNFASKKNSDIFVVQAKKPYFGLNLPSTTIQNIQQSVPIPNSISRSQ
jgi:hypothetical protein